MLGKTSAINERAIAAATAAKKEVVVNVQTVASAAEELSS